jgi:hypothetical protein
MDLSSRLCSEPQARKKSTCHHLRDVDSFLHSHFSVSGHVPRTATIQSQPSKCSA